MTVASLRAGELGTSGGVGGEEGEGVGEGVEGEGTRRKTPRKVVVRPRRKVRKLVRNRGAEVSACTIEWGRWVGTYRWTETSSKSR